MAKSQFHKRPSASMGGNMPPPVTLALRTRAQEPRGVTMKTSGRHLERRARPSWADMDDDDTPTCVLHWCTLDDSSSPAPASPLWRSTVQPATSSKSTQDHDQSGDHSREPLVRRPSSKSARTSPHACLRSDKEDHGSSAWHQTQESLVSQPSSKSAGTPPHASLRSDKEDSASFRILKLAESLKFLDDFDHNTIVRCSKLKLGHHGEEAFTALAQQVAEKFGSVAHIVAVASSKRGMEHRPSALAFVVMESALAAWRLASQKEIEIEGNMVAVRAFEQHPCGSLPCS